MSGAPRIRRQRPGVLRVVLRTIVISGIVLVAGYVAGLALGRALL
jgi:predicted secreted protein